MVSLGRRNFAIILVLAWLVISPYALTTSNVDYMRSPVKVMELAAPTISGPSLIEFENGTVGHTLVYQGSDPDPKNYTIRVDGAVFDTGFWSGGQITVFLVQLYLGDWIDTLPQDLEFNCTVFNNQEESASAITTVRVLPDTTEPIIQQPQNITYEEGSFGNEILWNVTEANPDFYNVTRVSNEPGTNFSLIESGDWGYTNFTINVDGLNASRWYIYSLFVRDLFGRNATSHVNVSVVVDSTDPTITSPDDIEYEFGDEGFEILWHAYDSNPKNYTITAVIHFNDTTYGDFGLFHTFLNVTVADWTFTDPSGQDIISVVDGLFLGNYTITLTLFDDFDRMTNDSVNVTVYEDIRAPLITSSGDLSYEEGYTGYSINWTVEESNPVLFNLTLDGSILENGTWDGTGYVVDVDGFAVGVYVYNMTYTDFFNQSAFSLIEVTVIADTHLPVVSGVIAIQTLSTSTSNNLTIQAYVWDLNNISNLEIQWGVGDPESDDFTFETADMEQSEIEDIFVAHLGNYQHGVQVWYKIVAEDDSSVQLVYDSGWLSVVMTAQSYVGAPAPLYAIVGVLGGLSLFVVTVRDTYDVFQD
ncbi:MAG: hypothetical protein ACXAAQ_03765 [Candidatus Thorarchaeota archaeon]|jgi:hypothetical protein